VKHKTLLLTSAAASAIAAPGAFAADLPMKAPYVATPAVSWTGWYIGGNLGAAWHQNVGTPNGNSANEIAYGSIVSHGTSFIGGGQLGYNWQNGNAVTGVVADIAGLVGSARTTFVGKNGSGATDNKIGWLSTFRLKGGLAVGNALVYVTAGVALGEVRNKLFETYNPNRAFVGYSRNQVRAGLAVGGGFEQMFAPNWSWGLEGLFVDLGKTTGRSFPTANATKISTFTNQAVIARLLLNYRFAP
jgi:outer membrane immunogenic protein